MVFRAVLYCFAGVLLFSAGCGSVPEPQPDADTLMCLHSGNVKKLVDNLAEPLVREKLIAGAAVGVMTPDGDYVFCYGKRSIEDDQPVRPDTLFQIGSVSKVFVSTLLARMAIEKRLSLKDPVKRLFPPGIGIKSEGIRNMSFEQLASHSSGLPQEAVELPMLYMGMRYIVTGRNPYEGITVDEMLEFFRDYSLDSGRSHPYAYSNVGYAFLGWLLGRLDKRGYEALVIEKVISPLGLQDTVFHLSESQKRRLAKGYAGDLPFLSRRLSPADPWVFEPGLTASGGLYSTVTDMISFIKANAGRTDSELFPAMVLAHRKRIRARNKNEYMGLGWYTLKMPRSGVEINYVDGLIGGYIVFAGFHKASGTGVVVLQNTCSMDDRIGPPLLDTLLTYYGRKPGSDRAVAFRKNSRRDSGSESKKPLYSY